MLAADKRERMSMHKATAQTRRQTL